MLTVGVVAGERSGDLLGASLIRAIKARRPDTVFVGVGGAAMEEAGCELLDDYSRLAVTGISEVLKHLPGLLAFRRRLVRTFGKRRPDVLIGIDAPDFNLGLEKRLKARGIPTVHYVSPSIWAWRQGRVKTVARAADRVLALLPFEPPLYRAHGVDAVFVGHPLADEIGAAPDQLAARKRLKLASGRKTLALLPGSRRNEIDRLAPVFLETAKRLSTRVPGLQVVVPMVSNAMAERFKALHAQLAPTVDVQVFSGRSRELMAAADAVMLASGTATLEAMLLQRPMVVAYRLSGLTRLIVRGFGLLKIDFVSLPNLLANREIVPELLQQRARPDLLTTAAATLLEDDAARQRQLAAFTPLIATLARGASARAADAVLDLAANGATPLAPMK